MKLSILVLALQLIFSASFAATEEETGPLNPAKLDHPRDTMRTFMESMKVYRSAQGNESTEALLRAIRTLNLSETPFVLQQEKGTEIAQLLKEVIDRVILIDYSKIPDSPDSTRWRLKNTEIAIAKVKSGDRTGEFLFTPDTVYRARSFYNKVKNLPYLEGSTKGAGYQEPLVERYMPDALRGRVFFYEKWQWLGLFFSIILGLACRIAVRLGLRRIKKLLRRTEFTWDHKTLSAIEKPAALAAACGVWYFSVYVLRFEGQTLYFLTVITQVMFNVAIIWGAYRLTDALADYLKVLTSITESELDDHLVPLLQKSLKVFIIVFGSLILLQNLGFNVTSVFAGLGLGGLAFALAARDTCANFFGSIMIFLDRPFGIGDWIKTGGVEGNVEEIGFRSTRIRTFYNSLISVPNSALVSANIDNMGKREFRRIRTTLSLTYDTPPEKMEAFLEGVKNIIKANPYTRKDYLHVVFNGYGASSLDVLVYCFLKVPDWSQELVEKQNLYLEILRLAKDLEVSFAFPTQTLHVDSFPEKAERTPVHQIDAQELRSRAQGYGPGGTLSKPGGLGFFVPPFREGPN